MSDEDFETGERHPPEEWVALLGLPQPVLESVPQWGPYSETKYKTDQVTQPRFMEVYATAVLWATWKPRFSLFDCENGDRVRIWFVGDGELEITKRPDRPARPLKPTDVQLTAGDAWREVLVQPELPPYFTGASIGDRLSIMTACGNFTTPKIKRIVVMNDEPH